jgi:uncharacterized protein (DUF169 family)
MTPYQALEETLLRHTGLTRRPVAVCFLEEAPEGIERFEGSQPSSCSFWRLAAEGRSFYTLPADHYNCPVGAYTHKIALPAERQTELPQVLGLMAGIGYVRMEEVPGIPVLPQTPGAILYAPLGEAARPPDVVLFAGRPGNLMLLEEAARRAGVAASAPLLGRPTCMALPAALASGAVASLGCIGNRVYTGIGGDEFYVAVAGRDLEAVAREAETIAQANRTLEEYHTGRRRSLSTA